MISRLVLCHTYTDLEKVPGSWHQLPEPWRGRRLRSGPEDGRALSFFFLFVCFSNKVKIIFILKGWKITNVAQNVEKLELSLLLVGLWNGAASLENSVAGCQTPLQGLALGVAVTPQLATPASHVCLSELKSYLCFRFSFLLTLFLLMLFWIESPGPFYQPPWLSRLLTLAFPASAVAANLRREATDGTNSYQLLRVHMQKSIYTLKYIPKKYRNIGSD